MFSEEIGKCNINRPHFGFALEENSGTNGNHIIMVMSSFIESSVFSGAPAARRAAKRSPIIIEKGTTRMHRNRNIIIKPMQLFSFGQNG